MSRIDNVLKMMMEARTGAGHPWIYGDDGSISDNVICLDTMDVVKTLQAYEISVSDSFIDTFIGKPDTNCFYTYNIGCNVSDGISFWYRDNCPVLVFNIHLGGDARIIWNTYFAIKMEYAESDMIYCIAEFFSNIGIDPFSVEVNDDLVADISIFSEYYNVYSYSQGEDLGSFWQLEKEDLLQAIQDTKEAC